VFKREAGKLVEGLRAHFADFQYETRKGKTGSFEVILTNDGQDVVVWSGLKLKPRREKFPAIQKVVDTIFDHLL